jgi:hypothetical protein
VDSATLASGQKARAELAILGGAERPEDLPPARPVPPAPGAANPGHCSDHPSILLVYPSRLATWDRRRQKILCTSLEHDPYDRERCVYCGGSLWLDGAAPWAQRTRRTFCSSTCRNYLWRWRRRPLVQLALPPELVP